MSYFPVPVTQAERRTREEAVALLEAVLGATHDAILVLDLDRQILLYNRQLLDMFGFTAEQLAREGRDAIVNALAAQGDVAPELLMHSRESWANSDPPRFAPLRFKDGRVFERSIAPHRTDGRVVGRVAVYRDITAPERARQAVEEHQAVFEKAQEVAHIGSWVAELDGSGRLEWSRETHRIFGLQPDQFSGTSDAFYTFVHPDDREYVRQAAAAARAGTGAYDLEHRIVRSDGQCRWVREQGDVVKGPLGQLIRMVGTVQDVTERRALEEQLRQSQKLEAIGRLAGGVAHDLNNALTAIAGYTELALGALPDNDPVRADVAEIRKAAGRAESVTRQLLAFSRKQMLEPRVFALPESIENVSRLLQRVLGDNIQLKTDFHPHVPLIYGDPGQIEQAILNLIVNARDAMPHGGSITLKLSVAEVDDVFARANAPMPAGTYVALSVADTGMGMSPETKAHVFEPFFTTKAVGKGTGLGLAMVYGTVKQSGGYIFLESAVGRGTTFSLYFPPAPQQKVAAAVAPPARPADGLTVLVVEDEPAVRSLVVTSLGRQGYRVLHAPSGEDALTVAADEGGRIDLLLTDASMPGMSGIELANQLVAVRPEMRVIVMSGYTAEALNVKGVDRLPLLPKPFTPRALRQKVGEVLSLRTHTSGITDPTSSSS